jgi:hypothetical protein
MNISTNAISAVYKALIGVNIPTKNLLEMHGG